MKTIVLLILSPFILLLAIPLGAASIGIVAGLFGIIVGLIGVFFGIVVAIFATLFGGLFSLGGITVAVLFFKLFFVVLIIGVIYLFSSFSKKSEVK